MSRLSGQATDNAILHPNLFIAPVPLKKADPPGLVLVPGAWHSPVHYTELIGLLSVAGYRTASQRLPSCNFANSEAQSVADDADAIRNNLILPQLDLGKEVVVIMHSYGGSPGSMAAKGLSLADRRAADKPGGIIGLIVICGFLASTGQSLKSILPGGVFDPWVIIHVRRSLQKSCNIDQSTLISLQNLSGKWSTWRPKSNRNLLQRRP